MLGNTVIFNYETGASFLKGAPLSRVALFVIAIGQDVPVEDSLTSPQAFPRKNPKIHGFACYHSPATFDDS